MRQSQLFGRTLRENPADAQIPSHQLLVRAGMIRALGAGLWTALPLAQRALLKIEAIIREEMVQIGAQEIDMPLVHPAELWRETGRYQALAGKELVAFQDRNKREYVLAMTHEESVTFHARNEIHSYRQLPLSVFQIKLKFRDEPRPRAGLIRVREFVMKDAYSFHADTESLDQTYQEFYHAYERIFARCGLPVVVVESDPGMIGGSMAHEFMLITPSGEDRLIIDDKSGYTANAEVAVFDKGKPDFGPPRPIEEVATPGCTTIEEVAAYLGVPTAQTMKAVFYLTDDERFIFAVIRGDLEINETKLKKAVQAADLRPATPEEIRAVGAVPGYASPIGLSGSVCVVIDDSIAEMTNGVSGANREGYHLKNVNYPRDFTADVVADIALARGGHRSAFSDGLLREVNGIEVGNIFKLGTKYSAAMNATYLDENGRQQPLIMGCYGIGVGRLLAAVVEHHHDENGIVFPISVAPFQVHLVPIGKSEMVYQEAERLYREWRAAGVEVLLDDRNESAGVKFKDSDLIGIPIRVTVSERTLKQNAYEVKLRWSADRQIVPRAEFQLEPFLQAAWERVHALVRSVEDSSQ